MNHTIAIIGMWNFGQLLYNLCTQTYHIPKEQVLFYSSRIPGSVSLEECYKADYILLCSPLKIYDQTLIELISHPAYQQHQWIIIDTCSIKERPKQVVNHFLKQNPSKQVRIVHTHGMWWPQSCDITKPINTQKLKTILTSYQWISTQQAHQLYQWWVQAWFECITMTEQEHDQQAAISQFRTYLIARIARESWIEAYLEQNHHLAGFNNELFTTCRIFHNEDDLFEPYAAHNTYCHKVITSLCQWTQHIEQWLNDTTTPETYFGTFLIPQQQNPIKKQGTIVAAFFKTLLMNNSLLSSTPIDTKNATRINNHLTKAIWLDELPYPKDEIKQEITNLIQATIKVTQHFHNLMNNWN